MTILYFLLIPIVYIIIRSILYIIAYSRGKFSYDGFSAAGFAYNSKKDLFYSTKNAWQKSFGYGHIYDVAAPIFRMIIDTEPIKFYYNNKNWLITFWKGQYGITTGAEIGIYSTDSKKVDKHTIYMPINSNEMLDMRFTLYKKNKKIIELSDRHWWLTAFKLGMFSNPRDLSMDIEIKFPNHEMLEAFLESFKKIGYRKKDFRVVNNTFYFLYKKPRTNQVYTRTWLTDSITQWKNRRNVKLYNKYISTMIETDGIDDSLLENNKNLIMINNLIPDLFKNPVDSVENISATSNKLLSNNVKDEIMIVEDNNVDVFLKKNICITIKRKR